MENFIKPPSTQETQDFYNSLVDKKTTRGMLGMDQRYNPGKITQSASVQKYFVEPLRRHIRKTDTVLDFGCGPGSFLCAAAPYCGKIIGVDLSDKFVQIAQESIRNNKLENAEARLAAEGRLAFEDHTFDAVILVDVLHHLENMRGILREIYRILKPGGRLLIWEPNKLNPLIFLVHLADRNEWGLLRLGTPGIYKKILSEKVAFDEISFNGIVIGPQTKTYLALSEFLNKKSLYPWLGWLNPKIFMTGKVLS